jgi:hypothetical protein
VGPEAEGAGAEAAEGGPLPLLTDARFVKEVGKRCRRKR